MEFRWIEWNVQHIAQHGVEPEEAEEVVLTGVTMKGRENALIATGPTSEGRFLFVVYKKRWKPGVCYNRQEHDRERKKELEKKIWQKEKKTLKS